MESRVLINDFATRSFRDIADQDYIAARLSYRHGLYSQFHWQSLQALEKYLKAILLYNRIEAKNINHDIEVHLNTQRNCRSRYSAVIAPIILSSIFQTLVALGTLSHHILFVALNL
ncbi:HEPN domain-containing protein [Nitrosomonas oligotropha]|uniref:HEPN domain-containing protein n=1 Tax=Nitrosomonas oligotropha TaxID=42354 RepID=UPI000D325697